MDQNDIKESSTISIKLNYELRLSLGLSIEEKFKSKFIRKENLEQKLQKLSIKVPEVEVCKNEVILIKVITVDRVDTLKIFLGDEATEKEIPSMLQERRALEDIPSLADLIEDEEQLDDTEIKIEEIKSRIWTSLGSDAEIILSHAPNQRPLFIIEAEIKARNVNSRKSLSDNKNDGKNSASFLPDKEKIEFVERKTMDSCIQVGVSREIEVQTEINFQANASTQWSPQTRDFEEELTEAQKMYLNEWVHNKSEILLDLVHHNLILESHVDDFQSLIVSDEVRAEREALKGEYLLSNVVSSFTESYGAAVSHAWHPHFKDIIAISYSEIHKNAEIEEIGVCDELSESQDLCSNIFAQKIIFWSLNTGTPQLRLLSSFRVNCISFHPLDNSILAGGCDNGDIKLWRLPTDLLQRAPTDAFVTVKGVSRSPIVGLHWLSPSSKGLKFLTVSSDGLIQLWCLEQESLSITAIAIQFTVSSTHLFYITASYLPQNSGNHPQASRKDSFIEQHDYGLVVGGHDGTICFFQINTQLKVIDEDTVPVEELDERMLDASGWPKIHDGPVADIKESPLEENLFLSTGGHTFCIFTLQTESLAPIVLIKGSTSLSSGCWSLYTKNVFYIFTNNGVLQVWNMLNRKSQQEAALNLSPGYIKDLAYPGCEHRSGILPLTDNRGSILICNIPDSHQIENKEADDFMRRTVSGAVRSDALSLRSAPGSISSWRLAAEAKERQRVQQLEQQQLADRVEALAKPERAEISTLRHHLMHKDKATRLEASRRLKLLGQLPRELLQLKRVDDKRLLEVEQPMLQLHTRRIRKDILRQRRVQADDADFLN